MYMLSPSGFTSRLNETSRVPSAVFTLRYTRRCTSVPEYMQSSNASRAVQSLLQPELPQRAVSSAQQKKLPRLPRLFAEGNSCLNFSLANTALRLPSATITAEGSPSIIRL